MGVPMWPPPAGGPSPRVVRPENVGQYLALMCVLYNFKYEILLLNTEQKHQHRITKAVKWSSKSCSISTLLHLARYHMPISTYHTHTHTPTHTRLTALCPGLPGWAGNRKVKPIWILPKQKTVSGSGISLVICKSAPRSRQITMPAPHRSVFYRPDALPATQPTASKHWRQICEKGKNY